MKLDMKKYIKKLPLRDYLVYLAIILGGVLLDQGTKLLALKYLKPVTDIPIWNGVLHLHFHLNDGAAFGSFSGQPYIFNTISVAIIVGMSLYLFLGHAGSRLSSIASAMIISGGIGNMIDRILFGEVTDFIYFKLIDFAIFNGADAFVCVGAGMLILALIIEIKNEMAAEKARKAAKNGSAANSEDSEEAPTQKDKANEVNTSKDVPDVVPESISTEPPDGKTVKNAEIFAELQTKDYIYSNNSDENAIKIDESCSKNPDADSAASAEIPHPVYEKDVEGEDRA